MEALFVSFHELRPKIGMRNVNQGLRTLAQRFALEVCHTVFGDDVFDIHPVGGDGSAFIQHGHDLGDASMGCGGTDRDDRPSPLGQCRTADEIACIFVRSPP